jgi:hypothetical protein
VTLYSNLNAILSSMVVARLTAIEHANNAMAQAGQHHVHRGPLDVSTVSKHTKQHRRYQIVVAGN